MVGSKYLKSTIVFLVFLLVIDIGSRIFFQPAVVSAKSNTQYKVIEFKGYTNPPENYGKLLNDMTNQGWKFDHIIFGDLIVFKK